MAKRFTIAAFFVLSLMLAPRGGVQAATPKAEDALKLMPVQSNVDFDRPEKPDECTIRAEQHGDTSGWVVRGDAGESLRRFADTNGDNKVDVWCYFKNGVEVYRDIDADFNGKADQYRWLGTAGIRWGIDTNEDGRIDAWKTISAEEVTAELVGALSNGDEARFRRLLINESELRVLGLGTEKAAEVAKKVDAAPAAFKRAAQRQRVVGPKSKWIDFAAIRPGVVPAGTDGSKKDVVVYENVVAMIETNGQHGQLRVGTLVQVGNAWRLIDLPEDLLTEETAGTGEGFFFQVSLARRPEVVEDLPEGLDKEIQVMVAELDRLDKALATATKKAERAKLYEQKADVLQKLATHGKSGEQREAWFRQLADTVSAAAQSGDYPTGIARLESLVASLSKEANNEDLAAYLTFRQITATYGLSLQEPEADYAKIQKKWLSDLDAFVRKYPRASDTPEAMLQLAVAHEFSGEEEKAGTWYKRIVADFPSQLVAKKAAGAIKRLDSVGKTIQLRGKTTAGRSLDLAALRGKVVLIHYWATWCEPCKQDMKSIERLYKKYGKKGFMPIGVSLDTDADTLADYLKSHRLAWPQLFEAGGLDSRYANELGILSLPTMILLDTQGKVINRDIHAADLETELAKRLR